MNEDIDHWSSILVLIFFFLTNFLVIFPVRVRVPPSFLRLLVALLVKWRVIPQQSLPLRKKRAIPLDFRTVPLASALILLACGAIDSQDVKGGVIGANGIKPINIMALFISLAYMSISLDATGLFRYLAFWVARKGGSSGLLLYAYLYLFFLTNGVIFGNDPVILSGTAFLAYFTRVSGIVPPTAWIFAQFSAANLASVVLVSSNPTNLVLAGAFSLSFTTYTAHLILPFLAAALLVFPVLLLLFRSPTLIPRSIELATDNPGQSDDLTFALVDRPGAIIGSILMVLTLATLVGTSTIGVQVWEVTVPPAVILLLRDALHDWSRRNSGGQSETSPSPQPSNSSTVTSPIELASLSTHQSRHSANVDQIRPPMTISAKVCHHVDAFTSTFPTIAAIFSRLPISLLPFAFLMFTLVQGLASKGWVEVFALWWAKWVSLTGTIGAIGGMCFIACLLCNVCGTNIGTTILLARVLQVWISEAPSPISPRTHDGAIYALALGSNYGAITLSFSASLAGMLWRNILRQKGIPVRARDFIRINFPIVFVATLASSAVLLGELYVIHRNG